MITPERLKILTMLEEGKVTAEEAARLLEVVGETAGAGDAAAAGVEASARSKKLKIRVYRGDSARPSVNVNVPLSLARWALKFAPEHAKARMGDKEIALDELGALLDKGTGDVITVEDADKNERVEISIE
ncbi:MAG: hypothetical protein JSU81_06145 [Candidatus Coatesbacteria bacterium]|nr:MAG: hypothetical protein JSU81_06145 [Candidatus Coatesbacteria bacterium]